jgi:hypothetical protein
LHEKGEFNRLIVAPYKKDETCGIERLQDLVLATSLRRTLALNAESLGLLPPIENVEYVDLSSIDRDLYHFFQEKATFLPKTPQKGGDRRKRQLV